MTLQTDVRTEGWTDGQRGEYHNIPAFSSRSAEINMSSVEIFTRVLSFKSFKSSVYEGWSRINRIMLIPFSIFNNYIFIIFFFHIITS